MQKSRKLIALTLAVLLVLSAMSCFVIAAPVYSQLPGGYMVVDTSLVGLGQQEQFDYELGGELYQLEYGVSAFSSLEAASAAWLPEGVERTIVLAPGVYSNAMTITSDMVLCGPYFGKNPNNNPHLDDYDPSMADWALKNGRSIDPTKEAVFTSDISISTGCNNLTIDGIAFTEKGRIRDTARASELIAVNYTFKNLYFKDSSCDAYFLMNNGTASRHITIDSIRAENNSAVSRFHNTKAESLELINSAVFDMRVGADNSVNSVMEYLGGIAPSDCLTPDKQLKRSYRYNHFNNFGGHNIINFAARESGVSGISQRSRVVLELIGNEFIDFGTANGRGIQDQISYSAQEFICVNNRFIMNNPAANSCTAFGTYYDNVGGTPTFTNNLITGNYFKGYKSVIAGSGSYPYYLDDSNVAYDASGKSMAVTSGGAISYTRPTMLVDAIENGDVLDYGGLKRIYLYPTDTSTGYYNFDFKEFNLQEGTTLTAYAADSATAYTSASQVTGSPVNKVALNTEGNTTYAVIKAVNGSTSQVYNVTIFAFPPSAVSGPVEGSSACDLIDLKVVGADSVTKLGDKAGYVVEMPAGKTSISPKVTVSAKASYKFYMDAACKYEASTTDVVKLGAKSTKFYIQVIAEDGTVSAAIPVVVNSNRKSSDYADYANIPSYAKKAVNYLNEQGYGIFGGDQNDFLNPRNNITRYELAKVMVVLSGINVEMSGSVKINEVYDDFYQIQKEAAWAIPYVRAATAAGLIQGISDSKGNLYFDGSSTTTREQFATVFMRSIASSKGTTVNAMYKAKKNEILKAFNGKFDDASKIGSWAKKSIQVASYYGYVNGDGSKFNPRDNIIRADVAVIIYNAL